MSLENLIRRLSDIDFGANTEISSEVLSVIMANATPEQRALYTGTCQVRSLEELAKPHSVSISELSVMPQLENWFLRGTPLDFSACLHKSVNYTKLLGLPKEALHWLTIMDKHGVLRCSSLPSDLGQYRLIAEWLKTTCPNMAAKLPVYQKDNPRSEWDKMTLSWSDRPILDGFEQTMSLWLDPYSRTVLQARIAAEKLKKESSTHLSLFYDTLSFYLALYGNNDDYFMSNADALIKHGAVTDSLGSYTEGLARFSSIRYILVTQRLMQLPLEQQHAWLVPRCAEYTHDSSNLAYCYLLNQSLTTVPFPVLALGLARFGEMVISRLRYDVEKFATALLERFPNDFTHTNSAELAEYLTLVVPVLDPDLLKRGQQLAVALNMLLRPETPAPSDFSLSPLSQVLRL